MLDMCQGLQLVLDHCSASFLHSSDHSTITVTVNEELVTHQYIIAEDLYASEPFPPFRASTMDGYAIHAADGPGIYPVVTQITAGTGPVDTVLKSGQVAYITTGSALPEGADAVIMIERTEAVEEDQKSPSQRVKILDQLSVGTNIRPIGSDVAKGQQVSSAIMSVIS